MDKQSVYQEICKDIKQHHCSLRDGCIQAVPGEGNPNSPIVFIGEAPGRKEDELGRPFVGAAGKLLEEALTQIGLKREDVYITNVVKCRPPDNRDPLPEEVEEHKPFLERELELIEPKLIVLLGRHALHWFLPDLQISQARGTVKRLGNKIFYPIYHPAAALYDPKLRAVFISDIQRIPLILEKIKELSTSSSVPTSTTQVTIFN